MPVGVLTEQTDLSPAAWVVERLRTFAVSVASIVPEGFDAYGRLFHPAYRQDGETTVQVSWSEVAAATERTVHPEMQWEGISGLHLYANPPADAPWDLGPTTGSLPRELMERLVELLRHHTATPERVWFCAWDGWGGHRVAPDPRGSRGLTRGLTKTVPRLWRRVEAPPTVELPGRYYYLLAGPIEGAHESMTSPGWQSVNLWWPDDRAWFVSTEIDYAWTHIGGTRDLIDELVTDPLLEVLPAELGHGVTYDSDWANPLPT